MRNKIMLAGASGIGKAQPLDEPILTSLGWKSMGELTLKDRVIDPVTGDSIKLLGIYDRGKLPVYRVTFSDGTSTRVSKDHLWEVIKKSHGEYKIFVVDTNYLLDNYKKPNGKNWKYPFMIPNTKPVVFEKKVLPIHPYILGFILGDGCISGNKNCSRVSTNIIDSNEVIQRLKSFGAEISLGNDYPDNGTTHFRILGLRVLKNLGLTGCKSKDKFIPDIYLKSSINDRKLLLAGLLDTDGSTPIGKKSKTCINYSTTSRLLAEQVAYLLRSLGETASVRKHDRIHEGKSITYLVHCNISFNPYLRRYKQEILDKNFSDIKRRNHKEKRVVDISYLEELPVRCIKVDSERGLYITKDLIVTHNTTIAKLIEQEYSIPFISGSVSDLLPNTKNILHKDMISRDSNELIKEDYQILNLRNKLFKDKDSFISDRSYLDSAAYFCYKQADKIPKCEVEHFMALCKMILTQQCTNLILLDFTPDMVNSWVIEDNDKRITNPYFQLMISSIMKNVLSLWGFTIVKEITSISKSLFNGIPLQQGASFGYIDNNQYNKVKVLIIREIDLEIRKKLIKDFINE